jgi:Fe-S cluster biogenesis protein NfuA
MRLRWQVFIVALIWSAAPSVAKPFLVPFMERVTPLLMFASGAIEQQEPDAVIFVRMSGRCNILRIAGDDYKCRAVTFLQNEEGRAKYTIAVDDPNDASHVISFSGDNGRRPQENLYELPIDRMLLQNKDRPKADGLPVASIELASGICKQIGSFNAQQISSVSCTAVDKNSRKYEFEYGSDGGDVTVLRIHKTTGPSLLSPF